MGPHTALRSGSFMHVDEEIQTAMDEAYKEGIPQEDEELRALQKIATLEGHPGWQLIRDRFMEVIEEYRSGRKLSAFLNDYNLSDAQIGQATRTMNLIADELTTMLNSVVIAVQEVERQKEDNRNATRSRMGSRAQRES